MPWRSVIRWAGLLAAAAAVVAVIVVLGAVLSTAATLFIADNAIQNYVLQQARTQEQDNMKIALLVLLARTSLSKIRNKTVPRFHTSPKAVVTTDLLPNNLQSLLA